MAKTLSFASGRLRALIAADRGDAEPRDEIRVLAVGLFDPSPARIASEIDDRRQHLLAPRDRASRAATLITRSTSAGSQALARPIGTGKCVPPQRREPVQRLLVEHHRNPEPRVLDHPLLDVVGELGVRARRRAARGPCGVPPISLGRETCPMPWPSTFCAFAGMNVPFGVLNAALLVARCPAAAPPSPRSSCGRADRPRARPRDGWRPCRQAGPAPPRPPPPPPSLHTRQANRPCPCASSRESLLAKRCRVLAFQGSIMSVETGAMISIRFHTAALRRRALSRRSDGPCRDRSRRLAALCAARSGGRQGNRPSASGQRGRPRRLPRHPQRS